MAENFSFFHTVSMEILKFLSHDFFVKNVEKFREINLVKELYSKMILQIAPLIFLAQICAKMALVKVEE